MDDYYWEITLMNKDKISIPPEYVDMVKRKWENKENITTSRQVIPAHQITNFEKTSRRKINVTLIEQASQAFNEPIIRKREFSNGDTEESVGVRWVKKQVTQREWEKYYAPNNYRRLISEGGIVVVAFRAPTHTIDAQKLQYCTAEEIQKLTK